MLHHDHQIDVLLEEYKEWPMANLLLNQEKKQRHSATPNFKVEPHLLNVGVPFSQHYWKCMITITYITRQQDIVQNESHALTVSWVYEQSPCQQAITKHWSTAPSPANVDSFQKDITPSPHPPALCFPPWSQFFPVPLALACEGLFSWTKPCKNLSLHFVNSNQS